MQSEYMHWAKTEASATYNLAVSGVAHYLLKDLEVSCDEVEISPPHSGYGYQPLQEAIAAKCKVNPENVVAAAGTSMANHLAMAALLQPGDEALIEQPTYEPILAVADYLRARVRRFLRRPENRFEIDPADIRKNITAQTRLIILTNLHNPTGAYTSTDVIEEIGQIAQSVGARVLADEVYLEMFFDSPKNRSCFHLGNEFVATASLTKAYGLSGLRCGWILADRDLIKRIWRLNDLFAATAANPAERLSVIALKKLSKIAVRAKDLLHRNRELLQQFFAQEDSLEVTMPQAGTIAFPRLKSENVDSFCEALYKNYQTRVVPGRFFEMPDHFRIGVGSSTEFVTEGLKRLKAAINRGL